MPRLPQPGGDAGNWGSILNDYLSVEHNADGTLKNAARPSDVASKYTKPGSGIPKTDLEQPVRDTLDTVATHTTDIAAKASQTSLDQTNTRIDTSLKPDGTLKDNSVTRGVLAADVAAALPPTGSTIAYIGHSIMANGSATAASISAWATNLTSDYARFAGRFATGGYTIQQVRDIHLPQVLALSPKPAICVILGARNNSTATGIADSVAAAMTEYQPILDRLLAAGILPLPVAELPSLNNREWVTRWNIALEVRCRSMGLPFVSAHTVTLADPATGGLNVPSVSSDGLHPKEDGAKAVGTAIADTIKSILRPRPSPLVQFDNDYTVAVAYPTFPSGFADANTDNLPDQQVGLGVAGDRRGLQVFQGENDIALAYAADPGNVIGRWLRVTRVANTISSYIRQTHGGGVAVTPGDVIDVGMRLMISGTPGDTSTFDARIRKPSDNSVVATVVEQWNRDIGPVTIAQRFVVPDGVGSIRWDFGFSGPAGQVVSIGQLTIRNRTLLGLA